MSNSLVHSLEGYVVAVFKDIYPTYSKGHENERDLNRSLHELVIRGERFLTIDLPALRKHLERCLDEGLYTPSNLYLSGMVSKTVQVPAYCRDLYLQIFDKQGKLLPSPNAYAIADLRQLFEGFGKLKHPCKQKVIDEEVANFLKNEEDLRTPTLGWQDDALYEHDDLTNQLHFLDYFHNSRRSAWSLLPEPVAANAEPDAGDVILLQRVCDVVSSTFGDLHLERDDHVISERPQHGHGRVSNLPRQVSKFTFKNWPNKLDRIFPYDFYAVSDLGHSALKNDTGLDCYSNHEEPSKLIAVPKTMSGPRLIGSEPNYHQWIQQLVRNQLERRVKRTPLRHCISFGDQNPNRTLALQSSIDGYFCTVDLKSASDRLSCWTIERVFRSNITILDRIHASRTRTMTNAINDHFGVIQLKKCFTQGSACTFPVQTIVYSMIAITAVLLDNGWLATHQNITRASRLVRVFGDDIIVPSTSLLKLQSLLSFLQLNVNLGKTFSKGRFRESCGLDAYAGVDVTPARVKRFDCDPSHEVVQSMVESSNNFFRRGMWHVAEWLQSHLRKYTFPIVPLHGSDGYSSFCGASERHLKKRWNSSLQRTEVRIHFLTSSSKKVPTQSAYDLSEYHFGNKARRDVTLSHLNPVVGGLGIVNKKSSVMRTGWRPTAL